MGKESSSASRWSQKERVNIVKWFYQKMRRIIEIQRMYTPDLNPCDFYFWASCKAKCVSTYLRQHSQSFKKKNKTSN